MLNFYSTLSSEVYSLDKPIGHSFGDVEYYTERLSKSKGPILEPAVGTGRILIPLLEKGFQVDGFDLSEEMLAICRRNLEERNLSATLFKGEMESYQSNKKYGAVIIPTGSFLLLHEREKSIKALTNFYDHLEEGGRLIVDLFLPSDLHVGHVSTRTWEKFNGDVITLETKTIEVDRINQYFISLNRYELWQKGRLELTELEQFCLRWYGVEEFILLLKEIGFTSVVLSSDYEYGKFPEKDTQSITYEAIKGGE
ncbi:class I SAM-dependent methyltransferase [Alteribacter aurantiacus]|uniref:class I SAM-dependent methyltransferase n=1 Tax=Alteribacter aurantiacus TaxID=254410 RepID=UPI00040F1337|nr:class I SAM-dependent methyltransferase [Alteribacter aurantiacus]